MGKMHAVLLGVSAGATAALVALATGCHAPEPLTPEQAVNVVCTATSTLAVTQGKTDVALDIQRLCADPALVEVVKDLVPKAASMDAGS